MTKEEIAEIEARVNAATGGRWEYQPRSKHNREIVALHGKFPLVLVRLPTPPITASDYTDDDLKRIDADYSLMADAKQIIPRLIAALRESRIDEAVKFLRQSPSTPLLAKIIEICDAGSAAEFGDADERLRAIRGLIIGEAV